VKAYCADLAKIGGLRRSLPSGGALREPVGLNPSYELLRKNGDLLSRIKLICPVQSCWKKYCASRFPQISAMSPPIPAHRGAFRDRHGRWARDAVDASGAEDEGAALRTAKSCGPDASTPASSWLESFPPMTVTNKPDHRGEREGNR
jgi:hypothetical protein